jgi:hypothetical protein
LKNRRFFNGKQETRFHSTSKQGRFGRELGMNIWTGLLFMEGAVADTSLARELAGDTEGELLPSTPAHDELRAARDASATDRWAAGAGQY